MSTSATPPEAVIEIRNLTKIYRDFWGRKKVRAVNALSLDVYKGEVFGLLGPNGSGKTTTLKLLLGLLFPTEGEIRILGQPASDVRKNERIGYLPEESYLYRFLNAYETLDYYGRLFKLDRPERRRRTEQLIEMVGLRRAGRRTVGTYSKGMARRIGLAQALINDPDLLILDEPTTGLDPVGTSQIKDVIKALAEHGKTVLLCSHLLGDVEDVCDRVCIMYGGKRRALGPVNELLERREVTQIVARQLDEKTIAQVRSVVAAAGSEVMAVEHPTDRLEAFFLRVVGQAQRDQLQTSGAEVSTGVAGFLSAEKKGGAALVESLVQAGRAAPTDGGPRVTTEPVEAAPAPRTDVLAELTGKAKPQMTPVEPAPPPSHADDSKPDRSVLDRLTKRKDGP